MNTTLIELFQNSRTEVVNNRNYYLCIDSLISMGIVRNIEDYRSKVRYHCIPDWTLRVGSYTYLTVEGIFKLLGTSRISRVRALYDEYFKIALKQFELDCDKIVKRATHKATPKVIAEGLGYQIPNELETSLNNYIRKMCSEFHQGSNCYAPKNPSVLRYIQIWVERQGLN